MCIVGLCEGTAGGETISAVGGDCGWNISVKIFESLGAGGKPGNFLIYWLPVPDEEWPSHWKLCRGSQQSNDQVRY